MTPKLLFIQALSPLHAGTGQSTGAVELAIARDRATGFPLVPGSSLKGSLRDRARARELPRLTELFGPETANASDHAGALLVGDANVLLLPARSVAGTFGWITSPYLLARLARDARECGLPAPPDVASTSLDQAQVSTDTLLVAQAGSESKVLFEDLDFTPAKQGELDRLAKWLGEHLFPASDSLPASDAETWRDLLRKRLCVVHDDAMAFFSQHGTDIVARVKLHDDTKTVENLWHEESLPVETVLVSLLGAMPNGKIQPAEALEAASSLFDAPLQLGGKATVGRGRCRCVLAAGGAA